MIELLNEGKVLTGLLDVRIFRMKRGKLPYTSILHTSIPLPHTPLPHTSIPHTSLYPIPLYLSQTSPAVTAFQSAFCFCRHYNK